MTNAQVLASLLFLLLPSSAPPLVAAETITPLVRSNSGKEEPKQHVRSHRHPRQRRGLQTLNNNDDNDDDGNDDGNDDNDDNNNNNNSTNSTNIPLSSSKLQNIPGKQQQHSEWYLPDAKTFKRTWLFGAGDLSEIGITTTATLDNNSIPSMSTAAILDPTTANHLKSKRIPTLIEIPSLYAGEYIADVSAGGLHSALLTNEGRILTAGGDGGGSSGVASESRGLGRDTVNGTSLGFAPVTEFYPVDYSDSNSNSDSDSDSDSDSNSNRMPPLRGESMKFVKVVASRYYTVALDATGKVWSTGSNAYGQLCLNDTVSRDRFHQVRIPDADGGSNGNGDNDGNNGSRDDGNGRSNSNNPFNPQQQQEEEHGGSSSKIIDVVLGERHTLLLREDGKLYGCGWNHYGQLGIGVKGENVLSPMEIIIEQEEGGEGSNNNNGNDNGGSWVVSVDRSMDHKIVTDVVAGRGSSYFLTSTGQVYATGTNYKGQLCLGHRDDRTLPTMISSIESVLNSGRDFSFRDEGVTVQSIAAGASSLYLLLSNGILLACGENTHGQLGLGNNWNNDVVDLPSRIANVSNVTAVFSGPSSYGAYLASGRSIYAVGFDGAGARENWAVPDMMGCANKETTTKAGVLISGGNDHTLYLTSVETAFDCIESDVPSVAPTGVKTPTPTVSPMPTGKPSISSMPTTTGPSSSPTISSHPTTTPYPTPVFTEEDSYMPTPFDYLTMPPIPPASGGAGGDESPVPVGPIENAPTRKNGATRYSSFNGFRSSYLLGAGLVIMWCWI